MTEYLLSRITLNANINHGKPSIRNTRHMVAAILEYLAGGDSIDAVLAEFPGLERDDILACIGYDAYSEDAGHIDQHSGDVDHPLKTIYFN